jgi:hypothetical protein
MFDPNIKVRVIADFKYRDESYVVANSHLSFDIYDSMKIAELVNLYNPYYEYRDHLELPSVDALPYHVREQVIDTYKLDKPVDAAEFLPVSDKVDYEVGGDTYTPYGYSPYESDIETDVKPIADSVVEVETYEPKFLDPVKPSVAEDNTVATIKVNTAATAEKKAEELYEPLPPSSYESDNEPEDNIPVAVTKEQEVVEVSYSTETTRLLNLNKEELLDKSANDIKKAVLEINPSYDYTNKLEAVKYLLTITK